MNFRYLKIVFILSILSINIHGQNPTDFELKSATNQEVFKLSEAKGNFVALHFLLKTECPYCLRHAHEYYINSNSFPNVIHVFIKPDTEQEIKQWSSSLTEKELKEISIYRDPNASLADQFKIPGGYSFHNQIVHYPALILLDPDGKEVFRYIGSDNSDRYSLTQFKLKINELTNKE